MEPYPELYTDRLVLREFTPQDASAVQRLVGEWEVARTLAVVPHPYPDGMAQEWIATQRPAFEAGERLAWAVVLRREGELMGTVTLRPNARDDNAELGYWIGRPYWGHGYATEAAREVVRYAFEDLGLHRIHAEHFGSNPASGKVMQKIGMNCEGVMRELNYTNNTGAGTATASASFAETANYKASSGTKDFTIGKADTTTTVTSPTTSVIYDGTPKTPCTAKVTGPGGLDQSLNVNYSNNTLGTATASASFAETPNYKASQASKTFSIEYGWKGFLQPINDTAHQTGVTESKFKLGQTIPVKFDIYNAAGTVVQQAQNPTFTKSNNLGNCDSTTTLEDPTTLSPDAATTYAYTGGHYQYNWSTKNLTAGEYRIYANLADGTKRYVDICLTK
jgi:ribosomal-protein-alanine N-acetyltransferase